jgi:diguanylate cyclase (GGDEF)-like protein
MSIPSSLQVVTRIVLAFVAVECLALVLLLNSPRPDPYTEAVLHIVLLALLATPLIHLWVIKPFLAAQQDSLAHIAHIACHDALTELPNRRLLFDYLGKTLAGCKRHAQHAALMMVDLNRFREINDTHGHAAGDALLIDVGKRLKTVTRQEDMVARLGGDEFVFLASRLDADPDLARRQARQIADKLLQALHEPLTSGGTRFQLDASIGIRLIDAQTRDVSSIIRDADKAMYTAKQVAGEAVAFYQE